MAPLWWYTKSPAALERQAGEQTAALLRQLAALETDFPTSDEFAIEVATDVIRDRNSVPNISILSHFIEIAKILYTTEAFTLAAIPEPPPLLDTIDGVRYREFLMQQHAKLADRSAFDAFRAALVETFTDFSNALPSIACTEPGKLREEQSAPLSIPVTDTLPDIAKQVEDLILPFHAEKLRSFGLFSNCATNSIAICTTFRACPSRPRIRNPPNSLPEDYAE